MRLSLALAGMLLAAIRLVLAQDTTSTVVASSAPATNEFQISIITITPTPNLEGSAASSAFGDPVVITSVVTPSPASVASSNGKHYHLRLKHDRRANRSCMTSMFH
jgi:hypothetical protein